jgi:hypothetical protein
MLRVLKDFWGMALPREVRFVNKINRFATFLKPNLPINALCLFRLLANLCMAVV